MSNVCQPPQLRRGKISDLVPDDRNVNKGTARGAPPFADRLAMLERLVAASRRVIVRLQPYLPGYAEEVCRWLPAYAQRGVHGVVIEGLKRFRKAPGTVKLGTDYCYPVDILRADYLVIREACHALGLRFYCGENRLRHMGDDPCCCGVADLPGWRVNRANLNHVEPEGAIGYTAQQQQPGTATCFRTMTQTTALGRAISRLSYADTMEIAKRTRLYLQVMGLAVTE